MINPADLSYLKAFKDVTAAVKQWVEIAITLMKSLHGTESDKAGGKIPSPKKGDFVNRVLLIGMEGVGKTQLIKTCFGHDDADPTEETEQFKAYYSSKVRDGSCHWTYVADYRGQDVGALISTFIEKQRERSFPLKYGHIDSVILMVDLRDPSQDRKMEGRPEPTADTKRIKQNVQQWNEMAIDAVFGLLTDPPLEYICLFVNKYDLISDPKRFSKTKAQRSYASLAEYLQRKVKPAKAGGKIKVDVIVGSAKYGDGHADLLESVARHSQVVK